VLSVGQYIEAKIVDLNETDKKISLSMKVLEPAGEQMPAETESVDEVVEGAEE
jgi:ribosomal protein S1